MRLSWIQSTSSNVYLATSSIVVVIRVADLCFALCERQIVWLSDTDREKGYAVDFVSVSLHAVSRDPESYSSPCIYTQVKLQLLHMILYFFIETGADDDESENSDSESNEILNLSKITEMRLVPSDPNQYVSPQLNEQWIPCLRHSVNVLSLTLILLKLFKERKKLDIIGFSVLINWKMMRVQDEDPDSTPAIGANGNQDLAHSVVQILMEYDTLIYKIVLSDDPSLNPDNYIVVAICQLYARYYNGLTKVNFEKESPDYDLEILMPKDNNFDMTINYYLVESVDGELLLVRRFYSENAREGKLYTKGFQVLKLVKENGQVKLTKIESLGNQTLFLGYKFSMSILADDFSPHIKRNSIYYTDDLIHDVTVEGHNIRLKFFDDMGIFSLEDESLYSYFDGPVDEQFLPAIWISPTLQ
ncbi:hypothetical protein RD792_013673 [Penstemon davidsonii]|uniref:KIB1-4 beta-propeller domain-containing protein n=1 Tax=Penstemon davidsonii TaxID=160366 RepID=A0ABR0CV29_9LAMI|nr:hypothetical protein RD792_013673 [Penstemon davidsonii]